MPGSTRPRIGLTLIGLAATLLSSPAARGQDSTTRWVEGHVFNKWTGVPLQNVVIQKGPYRPPRPGPDGGVPLAYTDANGFYSLSFHEGEPQGMVLTAVCFLPPREGERFPHFKVESAVHLRPGTLRRDLYIAGPRRKSFDYCRLVPFPR
jgi:hypothetical protein